MNLLAQFGSQLVKLGQRMLGTAMSVNGRVFSLSTSEVYSTLDQRTAVERGFNKSTQVYVVVKKDATRFGSIPRYVYSVESKEEKARRKIHPLLEHKAYTQVAPNGLTELLNRPNPYQSQDAFFTLIRGFYKVCGESFIWLNRGDISAYLTADGIYDDMAIDRLPILQMYVLPSQMITIIPDPSNPWGVLGYVLETENRPVMRFGDVIHWRDVNLSFDAASRSHLHGMSPLTPGSQTAEEANSVTNLSMRQAQNDGAKAILFNETMNAMTPTQQKELKGVIDRKINNHDVAGAVATLQGKWGLLNLAMTSKDLETIEKKKMSWREIALLFDVPPELVDTEQKYDNANAAILLWINSSIIPACRQLDGEMNRVLLKAFGLDKTAFIGSDYTDIPEVQQAAIANAKIMQDIWALAPDDIREYLGYERLGGTFAEPWTVINRTPISEHIDPVLEMAMQQASAYDNGTNKPGSNADVSATD